MALSLPECLDELLAVLQVCGGLPIGFIAIISLPVNEILVALFRGSVIDDLLDFIFVFAIDDDFDGFGF